MRKTFRYRLYPTPDQEKAMHHMFNVCRVLYNSALLDRQRSYKATGKGLNLTHQEAQLHKDKLSHPVLKGVHSQVLQDVLIRVDRAYQNFFRRVTEKKGQAGYPRFKFGRRYDSFTYPQYGNGFNILHRNSLFLSKIGDIPIRMHRSVKGTIKSCIVKHEVDGWYACISTEMVTPAVMTDVTKPIGMDVGLTPLVTFSNGKAVDNPHHLMKAEKRLTKAQRFLSRKMQSSQNYKKQRHKVALLHKKVADSRNDFLHQLSRKIVNSFTFIAGESLNIRGMVQNHHFSKHIHDAGWGRLLSFIAYKAEEAGKRYVGPPAKGSSQECCLCGVETHKELSDRTHRCKNIHCGLVLPRDHNAALVTLKRALYTVGTTGINAWGDLASTPVAQAQQGRAGSLNQEKFSGCTIAEKPRP